MTPDRGSKSSRPKFINSVHISIMYYLFYSVTLKNPNPKKHSPSAKDQKNKHTFPLKSIRTRHPTLPLSFLAPHPPPHTQSYSDSRPTTWSLMKEVLLQESNELEGHQGAALPQPQCSSAGPALVSHPPSSSAIVQASTALFSGPIKGGG